MVSSWERWVRSYVIWHHLMTLGTPHLKGSLVSHTWTSHVLLMAFEKGFLALSGNEVPIENGKGSNKAKVIVQRKYIIQ